jgi:hypothetical protein
MADLKAFFESLGGPHLSGQFNLVGPSYESANPLQDAQRLINWYCEIDTTPGAKTPVTLLGTPGLVELLESSYEGEVRGAWTLPGSATAVLVIESVAVLLTWDGSAFSLRTIGTLSTSGGQVVIRDNGVGGQVVIADGAAVYVWTKKTDAFNAIPDVVASHITFIDGWLVFNEPGTQRFFTSPLYWNGLDPFDPTFFALKDTSTDNLVCLASNKRELWLLGERTSEVWYDAGGQYFPFSRLQGATLDIGCSAKYSLAENSRGLIWLARDKNGQNTVVESEGFDYKTISSPAVAFAISQYAVIEDAIGYVYKEEGHKFYVLTFPTEDVTWVYDIGVNQWHQRASFDPETGLFHRHRSNCFCDVANHVIVGDFQNGKLWNMTRTAYTDGDKPLVAVRRTPHFWDQKDRNRVSQYKLQIEFRAGFSQLFTFGVPQVVQWVNDAGQIVDWINDVGEVVQWVNDGGQITAEAKAMVRWSNDGGFTWNTQRFVSLGAVGETRRRAIIRRMGQARDRIYELSISDPVNRDVVGASLIAEANAS